MIQLRLPFPSLSNKNSHYLVNLGNWAHKKNNKTSETNLEVKDFLFEGLMPFSNNLYMWSRKKINLGQKLKTCKKCAKLIQFKAKSHRIKCY